MYPHKTECYCNTLDKDVIVTVYYKNVVALGSSGAVPTSVECSGSPNGRCGRCNICPVLKAAQDEVRYGNF